MLLAAFLLLPFLYAYLGYPLLLVLPAGVRRRAAPPPAAPPRLDIVCVFHNEGETIAAKARDLAAQGYPRDRLRILLVSDGSTDGADRGLEAAGVEVLRLPRAGKSAALAEALRRTDGEIVVMTDANVRLDAGALTALAAPFADPSIGAVAPRFVREGRAAERLYAAYEDLLRRWEAAAGTAVVVPGACFAVRRDLLDESFVGMLCEDLWIGLRVLARGRRIVRAEGAVARERAASEAGEYARRMRIGAGNAQVLLRLGEIWPPLPPFARFALVSHKVVRWFSPAFLFAAIGAAAAAVLDHFGAGAAVVGLSALAAVPPMRYLLVHHAALALGLLTGLAVRPSPAWTPRR